MSGSRSVGRNEARLMLAQFRGLAIEMIANDDPGVLMLDGLAISELEEFLESGGESLHMALRGSHLQDDDSQFMSVTGLTQLRSTLNQFRNATDPQTKDNHRQQFFICYGALNDPHKMTIQPQIRSQIENTILLDAAHQETLLMTIVLPTEEEEEQRQRQKLTEMEEQEQKQTHHTTNSTHGERYRNTNTFTEEEYRMPRAQTKNLTQWICSNLLSQHVWFFIAGFCLFWIFFVQTWVDYAYGDIWRALLMELLCLASILIMMMESDTEFIRLRIQERLYNYYQFLAHVEGRTWFYLFLCFCAFGKLTIYDLMAIIGGGILFLLTVIRFALYHWSETCIDDFVITLHDSQVIRAKFKELDADNDGYLYKTDIDNVIGAKKCCCCRGWLKEIIFWRMDQETNDGKIDIHEFVQFCLKYRANQKINTEIRDSRKGLTIVDSNQIQN
eukprot:240079_1